MHTPSSHRTVTPQRGNDVLSTPFCKGYILFYSLAALAKASRVAKPFLSETFVRPSFSHRTRAFIHKGQFAWAAMLPGSFGVALAFAETYHALTLPHLAPGDVRDEDLSLLYKEPKPVVADRTSTTIKVSKVREENERLATIDPSEED